VISTRWLEARRESWRRLERLLERASRGGIRALSGDDLRDLGLLYRQIGADLAAVRGDAASQHYADHLQRLLARAHHTIYSGERRPLSVAVRAFVVEYPRVFRDNLVPCVVSLAIFVAAGVVGAALTYQQPAFKTRILGAQMVATIDRREMWTHSIVAIKPVASSAIMTNNMTVALTAFASGISAGVGTLYMIALNGLLLGVIGMAYALAGMSVPFWSFVAPHGSLELPAIILAGGAGLRLAQGLLFPGTLPRKDSVANAGGRAVRLVLGCIPMLIIAGVIEAFISPTDLRVGAKFAIASALFALLVSYLFWPAE
jgi:uncharacterized membrane protein SpoIIM required for sporulation